MRLSAFGVRRVMRGLLITLPTPGKGDEVLKFVRESDADLYFGEPLLSQVLALPEENLGWPAVAFVAPEPAEPHGQ